jgi:hypothetical protein
MNFFKKISCVIVVFASSALGATGFATKQGAQDELNRIMSIVNPLTAIDPVSIQNARNQVAVLNDLLNTPNLIIPNELAAAVEETRGQIAVWNKYLAAVPDVVTWKTQFTNLQNTIQPIISALVDAPVPVTLTEASLTASRNAASNAVEMVKAPIDQANAAILSAQQAFASLVSSPALADKGILLPWQQKQ